MIAAQVAFSVQRLDAEHDANHREAELRLVTDVAPAYIAHCDRDGRYLFVNRPFADRFQLTPEQVIGRTLQELLGSEVYERLQPHIEAALRGERVEVELELPYQHAGNRLMQAKLAPDVDAQGQVAGFVTVISDVTERRKATKPKTPCSAGWRIRCRRWCGWPAPMGIPTTTTSAGISSPASRAARPATGAGSASSIPTTVQRTLDVWYEAVRTATPYEIEYRFFDRKTNGYRWQLGRALPMRNADGSVARWFGTCTDIDDQKRAEQASRFLAEASRTLSTLVDYPTALETVATLAVPDFADWCAVDVVEDDGTLRRLSPSRAVDLHLPLAGAAERPTRVDLRRHRRHAGRQRPRRGAPAGSCATRG